MCGTFNNRMKKIVLTVVMMLGLGLGIQAQSVERKGNMFYQVSSKVAKADTLVTDYGYQGSDGVAYSIIVNKASGRCYVWKYSSKTGKTYKMYMKEEVSKAVCKELGIEYKAK